MSEWSECKWKNCWFVGVCLCDGADDQTLGSI